VGGVVPLARAGRGERLGGASNRHDPQRVRAMEKPGSRQRHLPSSISSFRERSGTRESSPNSSGFRIERSGISWFRWGLRKAGHLVGGQPPPTRRPQSFEGRSSRAICAVPTTVGTSQASSREPPLPGGHRWAGEDEKALLRSVEGVPPPPRRCRVCPARRPHSPYRWRASSQQAARRTGPARV
jgi:hypothetical protein